MTVHAHHYRLPMADGPTVIGVCACGDEHEFATAWPWAESGQQPLVINYVAADERRLIAAEYRAYTKYDKR